MSIRETNESEPFEDATISVELEEPPDPLAPGGIYFLNYAFDPHGRLEFFDFATRSTNPIFALEKLFPYFAGLALSPDGKSLLFGQNEVDESYIMLVKNFR